MKLSRCVPVGLVFLLFLSLQGLAAQDAQPTLPGGRVRTYYIAAVEIDWDYAPSRMDMMIGKPFSPEEKIWIERTRDRIGSVYKKAVYREYTDDNFITEKKRPQQWEHLGMMGPLIRAEVGDTIVVHFRNKTTHPYTIHPHGVACEKSAMNFGHQHNAPVFFKAERDNIPGSFEVFPSLSRKQPS